MGCGSSTKLAGDKTADVASGAPRASHEHFSAMLLAGDVANADVVISTPTEVGSAALQAVGAIQQVVSSGQVVTHSGWMCAHSRDLAQISTAVLNHCAEIQDGVSGESLRDLASMLASSAGSAVQVLDSFGPIGPLFKALGVFMQHVEKVQAARGEGNRLKLWAETLIPIIRQSVPTPFPTDKDPSKKQELVQCTKQAIRAIEELQTSICEVVKSEESWMRFFDASRYIDMMQEAQQRVDTAIDIIQKYMIADTKREVFKITAMLKTVVWGHLTDMQQDITHLNSNMETGFAEIRAEFKIVRITHALTYSLCVMQALPMLLKLHTPTHTHTSLELRDIYVYTFTFIYTHMYPRYRLTRSTQDDCSMMFEAMHTKNTCAHVQTRTHTLSVEIHTLTRTRTHACTNACTHTTCDTCKHMDTLKLRQIYVYTHTLKYKHALCVYHNTYICWHIDDISMQIYCMCRSTTN